MIFLFFISFVEFGCKTQKDHIEFTDNILEIAYDYRLQGKLNESIEVLSNGIATLSIEKSEKLQVGRLKTALAKVLLRKSFHQNKVDEQALTLYKEVNKIALKTNNQKLLADAIYGIGYYNFKLGKQSWDPALVSLEESLHIRTQINDNLGISQSKFTIGIIYQRRREVNKADAYFDESLKLAQEINSVYMEAENERHIGYQFYLRGNFTEAMPQFQLSLKLRQSINYVEGAIFASITIGQTLMKMEKYLEAIAYLEGGLQDAIKINSNVGMARAYGSLGSSYKSLGEFEKAKEMLIKAIEIGQLIDYLSTEKFARQLLSEIE